MQYPLLSLLFATLGVSYIVTTPVKGDDIVAVFEANTPEQDIRERLNAYHVEFSRYDTALGHLYATDKSGQASRFLYDAGASFVVDARFASFCSPTPSPRDNRGS